MKLSRIVAGLLLVAVALALPSCVELTGQRMSFYYDEERDELRILLFYDGIHEGGGNAGVGGGDGSTQIPEFVQNGDIMLLDWIGHLETAKLRDAIDKANPDQSAAKAFLQQFLASLRTYPIGRYRDGHDRVGAAQLIVIADASKVIATANAAINEAILKAADGAGDGTGNDADPPTRLTLRKIKEAAGKKHQWLSLEGHSLWIGVPLNENEWAAMKAAGLAEAAANLQQASIESDSGKKVKADTLRLIQGLTSVPLLYREAEGMVVLGVGSSRKPSTLRMSVRDEYNTDLEAVVAKSIDVDLDLAIGRRMLQDPGAATRPSGAARPAPRPLAAGATSRPADTRDAATRAIDAVIEWGPPEMKFAGLLAVARGQNTKAAGEAVAMLDRLGDKWNHEQGYPVAPGANEDRAAYLADWQRWLKRMDNFPLLEKHKPLDAPATQPATQPAGEDAADAG